MRKAVIAILLSAFASVGLAAATSTIPAHAHGDACTGVPDSGAVFNFHSACHRHDTCYGTKPYGSSEAGRLACDNDFARDMVSSCNDRYRWWDHHRYECYDIAAGYYSGVRALGWTRW
jgi:hypothetical protein